MNKNVIWVTGGSGKIGRRLVDLLEKDAINVVYSTDKSIDVSDFSRVQRTIDEYQPTVIVNCASLSNAEYCEKNPVEAYQVNALGARNIAIAAEQNGIKVIQLSTDDVFSGENHRSKNEFDFPTPRTVYGKSKLAGETFVRDLCKRHMIIRSSWVYGTGGEDYLSYVLDKAKKGERFNASLSVISTPTSADEVATFIANMINKKEYGTFHASDEGFCTRYQFATKILSECGYDTDLAIGTFAEEDRIVSTVLDNLMMKMTGVYDMPHWERDLETYIAKNIKNTDEVDA